MGKFICKYCGSSYSNESELTSRKCSKYPNHNHEKYEGTEKKKYICCYCGTSSSAGIPALTNGSCKTSPSGHHVPYVGDEKSQYACKYCGSKYTSMTGL